MPHYTVRGPIVHPANWLKYYIDHAEHGTVATVHRRIDTAPVPGSSLGYVDLGAAMTPARWDEFAEWVGINPSALMYLPLKTEDAVSAFLKLSVEGVEPSPRFTPAYAAGDVWDTNGRTL